MLPKTRPQRLPLDPMPVKVSAKEARILFHGCDTEYITTVCHGRCCTVTSRKGRGGVGSIPIALVVVTTDAEADALRARHGPEIVVDNVITATPDNHCPFHTGEGFCTEHFADKPTACHESPWTLNPNNTLIVRNRYRWLECRVKHGQMPAYKAFPDGLRRLFGADEAARITVHLDAGGGDLTAYMPLLTYLRVKAKNRVLVKSKVPSK